MKGPLDNMYHRVWWQFSVNIVWYLSQEETTTTKQRLYRRPPSELFGPKRNEHRIIRFCALVFVIFHVKEAKIWLSQKLQKENLTRSSEIYKQECRCCYFAALVLIYFCLTKDRDTLFRPETIVQSFLYLMVLICKTFINHCFK